MSIDAYPLVRDWLLVVGDRLMLRTGKVDIGQRISTALIRIATEELALSGTDVAVLPVRTDKGLDEGITSGSNSIEQSGAAQRLACATARAHILAQAAAQLECAVSALTLDEGKVSHRGTNRQIEVLTLLADLPADLRVDPAAVSREPATKAEDMPPLGLRDMVAGTYMFIHDLERDGMLHARIIRPPVLDAVLTHCDAETLDRAAARGVQVVRDASFLAVAGADEWSVTQTADALARACEWDIGEGVEHGDIFAIMNAREALRFAVIDGQPDPEAKLPAPPVKASFSQTFERPYTLHGALAPSAALAEFRDGKLDIKTHSQGIFFLRDSIAESLGMAPEDVVLEFVPGSGCYGHNAADDAAFEAALIARAIPETPVLLKYSRADEHAREPVGTAMAVRVKADTDTEGMITSLWMEARGDTHRGRPRAGAAQAGPARLAANAARNTDIPRFVPEPNMNRHAGLHRNLDPIYDFAKKGLVKALVPDLPLRPSALRCLGAPANILAIESMMDDLAIRAGQDAIEFRLAHLADPRGCAVLRQLAEVLKTAPARAEGDGRGVAYAQYKNAMTRVAVAVDLSVDEKGQAHLQHIRMVADAGRIVDPDGLRAQLEGGALQGASWALHEQVLWGPDGRETLDWESYPVLRFSDVPEVCIKLIEPPGTASAGAGEASPAPTVAAIANAIADATGLRLRRMPFNRDAILQAALDA